MRNLFSGDIEIHDKSPHVRLTSISVPEGRRRVHLIRTEIYLHSASVHIIHTHSALMSKVPLPWRLSPSRRLSIACESFRLCQELGGIGPVALEALLAHLLIKQVGLFLLHLIAGNVVFVGEALITAHGVHCEFGPLLLIGYLCIELTQLGFETFDFVGCRATLAFLQGFCFPLLVFERLHAGSHLGTDLSLGSKASGFCRSLEIEWSVLRCFVSVLLSEIVAWV
jgi:hypothetical protein